MIVLLILILALLAIDIYAIAKWNVCNNRLRYLRNVLLEDGREILWLQNMLKKQHEMIKSNFCVSKATQIMLEKNVTEKQQMRDEIDALNKQIAELRGNK